MPDPTQGIIMEYHDAEWLTNVPRLVTEHSPDGFSWGYMGSGPADLALNILQWRLQERGYEGQKVSCWKGECFKVAWDLHQEYKREVIGRVSKKGDYIPFEDVDKWLDDRLSVEGV